MRLIRIICAVAVAAHPAHTLVLHTPAACERRCVPRCASSCAAGRGAVRAELPQRGSRSSAAGRHAVSRCARQHGPVPQQCSAPRAHPLPNCVPPRRHALCLLGFFLFSSHERRQSTLRGDSPESSQASLSGWRESSSFHERAARVVEGLLSWDGPLRYRAAHDRPPASAARHSAVPCVCCVRCAIPLRPELSGGCKSDPAPRARRPSLT